MRRLFCSVISALVLGVIGSPNASAQQLLSVYIGGFVPHAMDARGSDDVLFNNSSFLSTLNSANGIDMGQFHGFTFGGEWLVALNRFLEAGGGIGFYQKAATTVYTNQVNSNGTEIAQELKLRIVPISATIRFLPLGHRAPVQPYVGGGVGINLWRYSETGQWVDSNSNIFNGTFVGSGAKAGPLVLGGVRFPVGPMGFGGEIRWQGGEANLPADQGFAGPTIDLGGFNYLFTVNFKF